MIEICVNFDGIPEKWAICQVEDDKAADLARDGGVRVDEDESTITTLCNTPKKGLGKLHFTGAAGVSTIELQQRPP